MKADNKSIRNPGNNFFFLPNATHRQNASYFLIKIKMNTLDFAIKKQCIGSFGSPHKALSKLSYSFFTSRWLKLSPESGRLALSKGYLHLSGHALTA